MAEVHHGIFTNARGERGEGFRSFFLGPAWPAAETARVDRWLRSLRPLPGFDAAAGAAVGCFRLERRIHACLGAVEPDFARDEHGRGGGFLVHAFLMPLDETRPAGDFGGALLRLRRGFERPEVDDLERLEAYLLQCKARSRVADDPVDVRRALALPDDFLLRLFELSVLSRVREVPWPAAEGADLAADLVLGGGLLPPRLRLSLRWALHLRPPTAETAFLRPVPEGRARPPARQGPAWAYLSWLRERAASDELKRVHEVVASWQINSWRRLEEEIRT